jgi:hypothetical protein
MSEPAGEITRLRAEVQQLRDAVMNVHVQLCRNGPSGDRPGVEQRNSALRIQLVAGHASLNEMSKRLDQLLRGC